MRRRTTCAALAATLAITLIQGPPGTATAAPGPRPSVQGMKSVPVAGVPKTSSKVVASKAAFSPDSLPTPKKVWKSLVVGRRWTASVDGFSMRTLSGGASAADVRLAAVGDGASVPRGPVFEIAPPAVAQGEPAAETRSAEPTSTPTPSASAQPSEAGAAETNPGRTTPPPGLTPSPGVPERRDQKPGVSALSRASEVRLDYRDFAEAYGGGWAGRLHLVELQDCEKKAGELRCAGSRVLKSTNDPSKGVITAKLGARGSSGSSTMVAAAAAPVGPQGDYTASPLVGASSWSGGLQSGDFTWSYPLAVPPGINGPEPDLSISYSSGSVDGRTSTTNSQASWIGEGFDLDPGFIERSYEPCRFVGGTPDKVGDLCWRDDHITISLNGKSSRLVRKGSSNEWRMKSDDGTRVERVSSDGINADDDGEYWRVTTTDGTQYFYGRNQRFDGDTRKTDSVSVVPVYGASSGDPCHGSTYAASVCSQAWRWGLDYVVDPNGNTMSLFWDQEKNKYGANKNATVRAYDRAAVLTAIEYGTRKDDPSAAAPARVAFTAAERCLPSADFDCADDKLTAANASHWPDVPFDQICTSSSSCSERISPTFFSRKRLAKITTQVRSGESYASVNEWVLSHQLPETGDASTDPDLAYRKVHSLWLAQIQQTGKVGSDVTLPPIKFSRELLPNRVFDSNGLGAFSRFRVNAIDNGTGGTITVNYSKEDCTASSKPAETALDSNARRCFPVWYEPWWVDSESDERQLEFFHKYRVDSVVETDNTAPSAISVPKVTSYGYGDGNGWHHTTSTLDQKAYQTWDEWRGYDRVSTAVGQASPRIYSQTLFMRGMNGDKTASGGSKSVKVTDGSNIAPDIVDSDQFAGVARRTMRRMGSSTAALVDATINTPWASAPTASEGSNQSYIVNIDEVETRTRLANGSDRQTKVRSTFDGRGRVTQVEDFGDTSVANDNRCTTTTYADSESRWMFDFPATQKTIGLSCGSSPTVQSQVIAASRASYDGGAVGEAPTRGNVTTAETAKSFANGSISYQADAKTSYDAYGRPLVVEDAKGRASTTTYLPATGVPSSVSTENAKGQTSVANPTRSWGSPTSVTDEAGGRTDIAHDGLGRIVGVWGPDRDKATQSASKKFTYIVSSSSPNVVKTESINAAGTYTPSVTFYDGLLRERATQAPAPGVNGGRVMTEKWYDDRGALAYDHGPYYNSSAVSTSFSTAQEADIPRSTKYTYDAAGRTTVTALTSSGRTKWSTSKAYEGDKVRTTPVTGGTATTEEFDARGQLVGLTQHTGTTPTGAGAKTTYGYSPAGKLQKVTNSSGSVWTKSYDVRGRLIADKDPDKGLTSYTYDATDQQVTSRDARNVTLWSGYDELDRKVELRDDSASGALRATWVYDTVRPGLLTSSSRYVEGDVSNPYTNEINSYDSAGRVTKATLRLPDSESELFRSSGYPMSTTYNPDGSVQQVTQPTVSDLTNEDLRYTYDDLGNVKTFKGAVTYVSDTIYSPLGEVLQRTSGNVANNSVYDTRAYDESTRRLQERAIARQGSATSPILDLRYQHDQAGNVTRLDDVATGDAAMNGKQWRQCFKYDYLQRMTSAWSTSSTNCSAATTSTLGSIAPYSDVYVLLANGNRDKVTQMRGTGTVTTTVRDSSFPEGTDPAAIVRPHAVSSVASTGGTSGTETFNYDEVGNMTKRSTSSTSGKTYVWDREGRVASVTDLADASKKMSFVYDADGNRLIERDATGATTKFTLNVGASQITVTKGSQPATNTSTVRTYTVDGDAVATRTSSGVRLMATDAQGTPLVTVNPNNLSFTKRRFTPFGEQIQSPGTTGWPSNKGFLNKTSDTWAGTTHLEAREYDSLDGRFISVDPVADFSDPQQLNGYAYANNAPASRRDPSGAFVTASDHSSYAPGSTKWQSPSDSRKQDTIPTYVNGWGRPMAGGPATYVPRYITPVGRPRDILGSIAANFTGTVDILANAAQLRTPLSDDYKSYTTDVLVEAFDLDTSSFLFQGVSAASVLTGIGSAGAAAGRGLAAGRSALATSKARLGGAGRASALDRLRLFQSTSADYRTYKDVTQPRSRFRNYQTNATSSEFRDSLRAEGWQALEKPRGTLFEKDGSKWFLRSANSSNWDGYTADFTPAGASRKTLELRLLE